MLVQRSSRSFTRHMRIRPSRAEGVSGWIAAMAGGSNDMTAEMTLAWLVPSNAFVPVSISYNTAPNAKMSARASTSFPSSCSGAMY